MTLFINAVWKRYLLSNKNRMSASEHSASVAGLDDLERAPPGGTRFPSRQRKHNFGKLTNSGASLSLQLTIKYL